jgi:hypothetical protein
MIKNTQSAGELGDLGGLDPRLAEHARTLLGREMGPQDRENFLDAIRGINADSLGILEDMESAAAEGGAALTKASEEIEHIPDESDIDALETDIQNN